MVFWYIIESRLFSKHIEIDKLNIFRIINHLFEFNNHDLSCENTLPFRASLKKLEKKLVLIM
jgi:hypothetical protein